MTEDRKINFGDLDVLLAYAVGKLKKLCYTNHSKIAEVERDDDGDRSKPTENQISVHIANR